MRRKVLFLLLCAMISVCGLAEMSSVQHGSDEAIIQCLSHRDYLERYHVYIRDAESGEQWVINRCDGRTEVFLPTESGRIDAQPYQRQKLLDAFDRSAEFVIRAVSSGKANERERIFGQQSVLEFFSFDNMPAGSTIVHDGVDGVVTTPEGGQFDLNDLEIFYILAYFDKASGAVFGIELIPLVVASEHCVTEMYIGYAYGEKRPEFVGVENSIDVEIEESRQQLMDEMGLPVFDFGQTSVYQDKYGNRVVVFFDGDVILRYAGFTEEGELLLTSNISPIGEKNMAKYLGKDVEALQNECGEFHGTLDLDETSGPVYMTRNAEVVCFGIEQSRIEQIYSIDLLTGAVQEVTVTP